MLHLPTHHLSTSQTRCTHQLTWQSCLCGDVGVGGCLPIIIVCACLPARSSDMVHVGLCTGTGFTTGFHLQVQRVWVRVLNLKPGATPCAIPVVMRVTTGFTIL